MGEMMLLVVANMPPRFSGLLVQMAAIFPSLLSQLQMQDERVCVHAHVCTCVKECLWCWRTDQGLT